MNTLTNTPLANLLQYLFAEIETSAPSDSLTLADLSEAKLKRFMGSKTEYHELYGRLKDLALPVPRETSGLLYMLACGGSTRGIIELSTSFDLSTLHLAAALRDDSGGHLIGSEFEPSKAERARRNLATGGLLDLMELREGDTLQTLAKGLPDSIDLALLDGAKALYPEILALLENRLRPGALVIADNAEHSPEYLAYVRSPANDYPSTPFAGDAELSIRLG